MGTFIRLAVILLAAAASGACAPLLAAPLLDLGHPRRHAVAAYRPERLQVNGSAVELPREQVMRVDVTPRAGGVAGQDVAVDAARGAASLGGLMMAIPYLITGDVHVPPARFWGLGAVLGAADAVQGRAESRERTVYVSRALVSGDW